MTTQVISIQGRTWIRDTVACLLGSLAVAFCAQIQVKIPYSPVAFTMQTYGILLVAATLGKRRAFFALLAYLLEGACGLPVFAGGAGGIWHFAGPTAGYLLAFPLAAFVAGWFFEKWPQAGAFWQVVMCVLSTTIIRLVGMCWLSYFIGLRQAFWVGVVPFLLPSTLKCILAVISLRLPNRFHADLRLS